MKLLTRGNPKMLKGEKKGYISYILHLAPYTLSGKNVCEASTPGCRKACLNTAGRGGIFKKGETTNIIQRARIARAKFFHSDTFNFMDQLLDEILNGCDYAWNRGMEPCFRLNGTSDILWEAVTDSQGVTLFDRLKYVQFYDYTKIPGRVVPKNYHLTFSRSETNHTIAELEMMEGKNVAVVFHTVPKTWNNKTVIDGDETDLRFLDPPGVIVGLKAKGRAKKDTTGFVI